MHARGALDRASRSRPDGELRLPRPDRDAGGRSHRPARARRHRDAAYPRAGGRAHDRLVTTFEPKWDDVTTPSRVVYLIDQQGDYCRLTVEHHGLNNDPQGGTADGWERSIAGLKTWLETGVPTCFGGDHLWAEFEEQDG